MTRIGFLGVGWIGRHRMAAMLATGTVEAVAIADPSAEMVGEAQKLAPGAEVVDGFDAMLALEPDGVVIATPSALHADQSIRALEAGAAVFCQKPLGRDAAEAARVVAAAKAADRLLSVDFSYRFTAGMAAIKKLIDGGELGRVFAVDLVFHNAYGPDKPWFYDPEQSGGGCVMDLGVHLVDLLLWTLEFPRVLCVSSRLHAGGKRLMPGQAGAHPGASLEDHAFIQIELETGAIARLACSWRLHAGCDAVIGAVFYGTRGAAMLRNSEGSFYDFVAEHCEGTRRRVLASPPDEWSGRAACAWARRLASDASFDAQALGLVEVSRVIDAIYAA